MHCLCSKPARQIFQMTQWRHREVKQLILSHTAKRLNKSHTDHGRKQNVGRTPREEDLGRLLGRSDTQAWL